LVARDDYVLDCFQAASAKEHDYVWMTHIDGKPVACAVGRWQEHTLSAEAPWKYLRNPRRAPSEGTYWEVFEHEGRRFRLDVVCDGPIEVVTCDFPLDDSDSPATMPMRMIRARRPIATFTAVYQSGNQAPAEAKIELVPDVLDTFQSRITIAGRGTVHRIPRLAVPKE
jgi:hypothetical protein